MVRPVQLVTARAVIVGALAVLAPSLAAEDGWRNIEPTRRLRATVRELWRAPLAVGLGAFAVEWRDGATGEVSIVSTPRGQALKVTKRTDAGYALVRARDPFAVPIGTKLQALVDCEARNADCEYSLGFLQLYGAKEDLSYFSRLDFQGRGGPTMTRIVNTAPGMPCRKMARFVADEKVGTNITAAIVVAGAPSTSIWGGWIVEDFAAASRAWAEKVRNRRPPAAADRKELSDAEFEALLASEPDHTARVERRAGRARFVLDGKVTLPVFFKASTGKELKGFFGGAKMASAGVDLQSTHIRFGVTKEPDSGFWSTNGFDAVGAVREIRKAMKRAPHAKFLLSVDLSAYPQFADEHPDEVWVNDEGRRVFGHHCHSAFSLPKMINLARHWYWISNHSIVWREAVKTNLTSLVVELKRTGLSKRIVGVHLAGYHDGQFSTVHPDYSKPAIAGFRRWLRAKYPTLAELRAAWRDASVTYDTATPPVLKDAHGQHLYFSADADRPIIDYQTFLKRNPFHMQEDIAQHVKKCFGKDIVAVRYCMSPFGGSYNAAYDIEPFVESDAIDVLCAQPNYGRRLPGFPSATRVPFESFHRHGKLFLNEFDLRTYAAYTSWEGELAAIQYGRAEDDAMWCTINRKLAGQMYAADMGWWYLDMAGGWFEPDGIAADIAGTLRDGRALLSSVPSSWRPDVAFVTDEDGLLTRNLIRHYFNPDEAVQNGEQVQVLAGAGVPHDDWLLSDWLADPALATRYKLIVFWGLYDIDEKRAALVRSLAGSDRTLVFLAGAGVVRGVDATGFVLDSKPFPSQHETLAEPGVGWNMASLMPVGKITEILGVTSGWPWQYRSPPRLFVKEAADQRVTARFEQDGTVAVAEKSDGGCTKVYVAAYGGLTPDYFHHLAVCAGAYVPVDRPGLEVDMNGEFLSVHCLRPGTYNLRLPFRASAVNLKTDVADRNTSEVLRLDLTAGETRWYRIKRDLKPNERKQP